MSEEAVQAECDSALADAGFAREQVRFFRVTEVGADNIAAAWFRLTATSSQGIEGFPGNEAQRTEANSDENRNLHRIAVPAAPDERVLFAAPRLGGFNGRS
jgi:hypothetical protein